MFVRKFLLKGVTELRVLLNSKINQSKILLLKQRYLNIPNFTKAMTKTGESCGVKIGTHNGVFHCDEVLACYMLRKLPEYQNAEIVRTRDQDILDTCKIVVDVGAVYDPSTHRYDHHQREFKETMNSLNPSFPWKTKLSSAGLVYYHFGRDIIKSIAKDIEEEVVDTIYRLMYEYFIQEIDGIDNGVPMFEGEPAYRITTNLSSRVSNLKPAWNNPNQDETEGFYKALELVAHEFEDRLFYYVNAWWPARHHVKEALENRYNIHESGEIILFDETVCCPWKEHLFALESEMKLEPSIKFVLFKSQDMWRVQGVPLSFGSFVCRVFLWKDWCGIRDDKLVKITGIDGCVFVHSTGFIGGNKTRDGALQMAVISLQKHSESMLVQ